MQSKKIIRGLNYLTATVISGTTFQDQLILNCKGDFIKFLVESSAYFEVILLYLW